MSPITSENAPKRVLFRSRSIVWITAAALALTVIGAHYVWGDFRQARTSTEAFHGRMDRGQYSEIADAASDGFRSGLTQDQLIGFLRRINLKLGTCSEGSSDLAGFQITTLGSTPSRLVTTTSSRMCANGFLSEEFVWQIIGGRAVLLRYTATNPLLLSE